MLLVIPVQSWQKHKTKLIYSQVVLLTSVSKSVFSNLPNCIQQNKVTVHEKDFFNQQQKTCDP